EIDSAESKRNRAQGDTVTKGGSGAQKKANNGAAPMTAMSAKQRAQGLLEEAHQLEKKGKLLEAQAKAVEARTAAAEAYRVGLAFGPGEESPDLYLSALAKQGKTRIEYL